MDYSGLLPHLLLYVCLAFGLLLLLEDGKEKKGETPTRTFC